MATINKRIWRTKGGETKSAWVLHYVDRDGQQHRKQFAVKRDADAERVRVEGEMSRGVHVPDRASQTVAQAAKAFLADFESLVKAGKREATTLAGYDEHVRLHLTPFAVAKVKLSRLNGPECVAYARALEAERSDAMASRVFGTFRMILSFAAANGWCAGNPARDVRIRTGGDRMGTPVEVPPKEDLRRLLASAADYDTTGHAEALVRLLMFGGLRASEARGLTRADLDLVAGKVHIRRRADEWQRLGPVKTKRSQRTIPLPPATVSALRRWLVAAPVSKLGLVFPTGIGTVESYQNIYHRLWTPMLTAAGLVTAAANKVHPHFALHALRHVAVSLWVEQGASPKQVQTWAGHASIQFTMDRYGHLWSDQVADQAIAGAAERSLG